MAGISPFSVCDLYKNAGSQARPSPPAVPGAAACRPRRDSDGDSGGDSANTGASSSSRSWRYSSLGAEAVGCLDEPTDVVSPPAPITIGSGLCPPRSLRAPPDKDTCSHP